MEAEPTTLRSILGPAGGMFSTPGSRDSVATTQLCSLGLLQEDATDCLVRGQYACPWIHTDSEQVESPLLDGLERFPGHQIAKHLPETIAVREYNELECRPRCAAALYGEQCKRIKLRSRIPYFLATPKYKPITTLTRDWNKFMEAFFALFYCHAMLWSVGIRHGDISENNLMWDPVTAKPKLCDFDFSHSCPLPEVGVPQLASSGFTGFSSTGTWMFMAKDLLTSEAMAGPVKRVYRHEVEAFIAVLVWIAYRYEGGRLRDNPPFENWKRMDHLHVSAYRTQGFNAVMRSKIPKPPCLPVDLRIDIDTALAAMLGHQGEASSLLDKLQIIALQRHYYPNKPAPTLPGPLEDWNDLRALRTKILTWNIFTRPSAQPFVRLMNECILNAPHKEQE